VRGDRPDAPGAWSPGLEPGAGVLDFTREFFFPPTLQVPFEVRTVRRYFPWNRAFACARTASAFALSPKIAHVFSAIA
jgi:hypothetical protein